MIADGIVQVCLEDKDSDPTRVRLAHDFPPLTQAISIQQTENSISLRSASLRIEIDLQPFHISYYGADGQLLLSQNYSEVTAVRMKLTVLPFGVSRINGERVAFHDSFTAEPDEHFFGLVRSLPISISVDNVLRPGTWIVVGLLASVHTKMCPS